MRTKALLLAAALCAAGVASSLAQPVYSVNIVGYVNVTVPANGKLAILANPFKGNPNNLLDTIMPIPTGFDGTTIYRFDMSIQDYRSAVWSEFFGIWLADPQDASLDPGEGIFVQNFNASQDLTLTYVGDVLTGTNTTAIPDPNLLALRSSVIPQNLPLGDLGPNQANSLEFPAHDGDTVYVFDTTLQDYVTYVYSGFFGGWLGPAGIDAGPVIAPGTGFWIQASPSAMANRSWTRTFNL